MERVSSRPDLLETILDKDQLRAAFKAVKSNKGAAGVDGITVYDFAANTERELDSIVQSIRDRSYQPSPVKRVKIPKPNGKGIRLLGVPTVRDRVLQYSIKMSLEPIFEKKFSDTSFGFRPNRNQRQAVEQAKEYVKSGKEYVVDIDLEKCFDQLNHDKIIHLVSEEVKDKVVIKLIAMTLRSGVLNGDKLEAIRSGSTQGSPLSPLLSNIVLDGLDKELESRGLSFCRYADDCNIFVKSEKAAERVMVSISKFIEKKLKLTVNREKSKVALSRHVKFLGMTIVAGALLISQVSIANAMEKVRTLTPRRTHQTMEQQIAVINRWYDGWSSYYSMTEHPSQLRAIEARIRRRLRVQLVRNQKRKRHLASKLISRGVSKSFAYGTVYKGNRKWWNLSHTNAVEIAWSNIWFRDQGLSTWSGKSLPHWQPLGKWVKLT